MSVREFRELKKKLREKLEAQPDLEKVLEAGETIADLAEKGELKRKKLVDVLEALDKIVKFLGNEDVQETIRVDPSYDPTSILEYIRKASRILRRHRVRARGFELRNIAKDIYTLLSTYLEGLGYG